MKNTPPHPVPKPRWAALQDDAFWVPMKGVVSKTAQAFSLDAEAAGGLVAEGMAAGIIAHKPLTADKFWVVAERGAELVKIAGFSYEDGLDWENGCMLRRDASAVPLAIFWPDVQKAAQKAVLTSALPGKSKPKQEQVNSWMLAFYSQAQSEGRPPPKREEVAFADCRSAIGATDAQMRDAMLELPVHLKRRRGQRGS